MKMEFLEPGEFVRWWEKDRRVFVYNRLLEREGPLKYPYTFSVLAAGAESDQFKTQDLNPAAGHIYNWYLGVRPGIQVRVWHPYDEKQLKLDEVPTQIDEDETANITSRESPYEDPKFSIWVIKDRYPGLVLKNIIERSVKPQIIYAGMKYNYEEVVDSVVLDKLKRSVIKSTPISWKKIE